MEYKKNKKQLPLAFKKKVGEAAVANKQKLEAEKPADVWNAKKRKWAKPSGQILKIKLVQWSLIKIVFAQEGFLTLTNIYVRSVAVLKSFFKAQ